MKTLNIPEKILIPSGTAITKVIDNVEIEARIPGKINQDATVQGVLNQTRKGYYTVVSQGVTFEVFAQKVVRQ